MPSDQSKIAFAVIEARENIRLIQQWASEQSLETIRSDRKTRYAIERAFVAIDAALKDVLVELLNQYGVPIKLSAGFRNLLAHTYDDVLDERVVLTIKEDLPALDAALLKLI